MSRKDTNLWDITDFSYEKLALTLRNQEVTALFSYPWSEPVVTDKKPSEGGAEAINIKEGDLFDELAIRMRYWGFCSTAKRSRNALNGKIASSQEQMVSEVLKFGLRRYRQKMMTPAVFVEILKGVALLGEIPKGFWVTLQKIMGVQDTKSLQSSIEVLYIFHEKTPGESLDQLVEYLSRALWFKNEFELIGTGAKQLALFHRDHPQHMALNSIGDKANSMIMKQEIEAEQATMKPWQRKAPGITRRVRTIGSGYRKQEREKAGDKENPEIAEKPRKEDK